MSLAETNSYRIEDIGPLCSLVLGSPRSGRITDAYREQAIALCAASAGVDHGYGGGLLANSPVILFLASGSFRSAYLAWRLLALTHVMVDGKLIRVALGLNVVIAVSLLLIFWVQEGIFRTYQSRLGERILRVEQLIRQSSVQASLSYQLHSEWLALRPGLTELLAEYGKSMLRPTVAFPHVLLILMNLGWSLLS